MKGFVFGFVFIFLLAGFVSAAELLYDGFESGNLNGWSLYSNSGANNWTASQTNPYQGSWHAQSQPMDTLPAPASVMEHSVNTEGYSNITFKYRRKLVGLDVADEFGVSWFNGNSWIYVEQTGSSSANQMFYHLRSFNLPASANNNPNLKIRFECTAGAVSEYCRVDNVNVSGKLAQNVAVNYAGSFEYMPDKWYSVLINQTSHTLTFSGLNASNQYDLFVVPYNTQGFSKRVNYVWFNGWFDNTNLYISQYVGTGNSYSSVAYQTFPQVYISQISLPNSVYLGINVPIAVNLTIDFSDEKSTFDPILYPGTSTFAYVDSDWNAAGHSYGAVLYQSQILANGSSGSAEISEWVKEDLASNGLNPRWTVPLTVV